MKERICINCIHFQVESGTPDYSELTPGDEFRMACVKGYWELRNWVDTTESYRKKIYTALECKDYVEVKV